MRRDFVSLSAGLVFLFLAGLLYWQSTTLTFFGASAGIAHDPRFFPRLIITLIALLSLVLVVQSGTRRPVSNDDGGYHWGLLTACAALIGGYFIAVPWIGFALASMAFMVLFMVVLGYRHWPVLITVSVGLPVVVWYAFHALLRVSLPTSPFSQVF